jgi:site-specific recombinase XerD
MKPTNFSLYLSNFLTHYLADQRNVSPNTIKAYRDVFILLLRFCRDVKNIPVEKLQLEQLNVKLIEAFLDYLEKDRHCKSHTLNHRLAALHAFFRYVQVEEPRYLLQCQQILAMPLRRFAHIEVSYLSKDHLAALLAQPNINKPEGRRDAVLLSVLYDTGARVQEIVDLTANDIRLETPAQIRLLGKGRKTRIVPLMDNTATLLRNYLHENNL